MILRTSRPPLRRNALPTPSPACPRRPRLRAAAALVATALLAGACTVGPDYVRPQTPVPAAWKEARYKPAEPADTAPRGAWWEVFGDPVLDRLETDLAAANPTLQAAEANYRQAQAALRAANAGLYPAVTAGVSAARSEVARGSSGLPSRGVSDSVSLIAQASWEIDLWGRLRRTVEAGEASAQASAADAESVRLSLAAQLAQSYLALRVADVQRRLLDETVVAYERSLSLTQNRYGAGVVARSDVVQAQTQLLNARAQRVDVGAARAQLEHAIAVLTGKPPADLSIAADDALPRLPEIPVELPSSLLERRPDVAAAERRVAAANAEVGVATAAIYPSLTLSAGGGFTGSTLANWLTLPNRFWSLGPALAATVFDAGLRRAQRDQQIAAYDASVASYRQTVLSAFQDVEDSLSTLRILADEAGVRQDALAAARELVALTTNQYKAGTTGFLNVVVAQAVALGSEQASVDVAGRRLAATVALVKALGGAP